MFGENWKFSHAGMIVKDNLATLEQYKRLGFTVLKGPYETPAKSADNPRNAVVAWIKKDAMVFEVIQPIEGRWPNKEFVDTIGDGVNHLCFEVADLADEKKKMEALGYPEIYGFVVNVGAFAYFDTRKHGGIMIELLQLPAKAA